MHHTTTNLAQHITARLARPFADVHVRRAACIAILPLILALVGALASVRPAPRTTSATQAPIIMIEQATAAPAPTATPTAGRALIGYFDYTNPKTATLLDTTDITRVVGMADDWRLIETPGGDRVWIAAGDVPSGVPSDEPLADLAPEPTPIIVYVAVEPAWHPPLVYHEDAEPPAPDAAAPCGGPNVVPPACH